eukprot:3941323-Rhodomonas_salina.2
MLLRRTSIAHSPSTTRVCYAAAPHQSVSTRRVRRYGVGAYARIVRCIFLVHQYDETMPLRHSTHCSTASVRRNYGATA